MAHQQPTRSKTMGGARDAREIPDKLYFRIGEVAKLCEVPAYVLRFWESEFPQLKPNKGGTGQRLYRRRDVEMALRVKTLLYDEGYTIAGARQALKSEQRKDAPRPALAGAQIAPVALFAPGTASPDRQKLQKLRDAMQELLDHLSDPAVPGQSGATVRSIRSLRARRLIPKSTSGSLFADATSDQVSGE